MVFILVRKGTVYPNSACWENCEFCPNFAYSEGAYVYIRPSEALVILRLKLSSLFQHIPIADVTNTIDPTNS